MKARDIIVIGGSAGAVTALSNLVAALPADLPAAVFVAIHVAPDSAGLLPSILARSDSLPAVMAADGDAIEHGRILVAPPERHLSIEPGRVRVDAGPRVNRFRPSVDVLFRSAATAYGSRVAAVVLSGMLDDGTYGLWTVKQNGGVAIVQDTFEAAFTAMPLSAIDQVEVDHVLPVAEIGALLGRLARTHTSARTRKGAPLVARQHEGNGSKAAGRAARNASRKPATTAESGGDGEWLRNGRPTVYGCPDCGGALLESDDGGVLRFRCRIGHGYTAESLLASQDDRLEDALWTAVRSLEETAATRARMATRVDARGASQIAAQYQERADSALAHAATIRQILEPGLERASRLTAIELPRRQERPTRPARRPGAARRK